MRQTGSPALSAVVAAFVGVLSALSILTFSSTSLASLNPVDLALGKPATQSSTLYGSDASLAVDGNTDGDWNDGSVTYTGADVNSWWEVDLGQSRQIGSIEIFNRTDCCLDAISPFVVLVSDAPIIDDDIVASGAEAFPGIMRTEITYAYFNYSIPINRSGRYVRIALLEQNNLSLAEVKVFEAFNAALGRTATQSSTRAKGSEANRAVDGNVNGALTNGVDATTKTENNPWWEVNLGLPSFVNGLNVWSGFASGTSRPGFYVFTSLTPFTSDPLVSLPPGVTKTFINAQGAPAAASIGAKAQYIRIEISGTASLSLAEVQVWLPAHGAIGSHGTLSSLGNSFTNPNGATDFYSGAQGTDPLTAYQSDPYLELDLGGERYIDTIKVWGIALNSNVSTFSLFVSTVPFTSPTVAGTRAQGTATEWILRGTTEDTTAAIMQRGRFVRVMLEGSGLQLGLSEVEIATPEGAVTSPFNSQSFDVSFEGTMSVPVTGYYSQPNVSIYILQLAPSPYSNPYGIDDEYIPVGSAVSAAAPVITDDSPYPVYPFDAGTLTIPNDANWPNGGMAGLLALAMDVQAPLSGIDFDRFHEEQVENPFWPEIRVLSEGTDADYLNDHLPYLKLPMGNAVDRSYYTLNSSGSYVEIPTTYAAFKKQYFPSTVATANAKYYNDADLGIGRNMTCGQPSWKAGATTVSGVVCAVENYAPPSTPGLTKAPIEFGDVTDSLSLLLAAHPVPFATVVMVKRNGAAGAMFGVYDKNGNRILSPAYLDGTAYNTAVPNNCVACHGGTAGTNPAGLANRSLLPFDPLGFVGAEFSPYRLSDQTEAFRKLNAMVLASNPTPAIQDFINGTYHGAVNTPGTAADPNYVPAGWSQSDTQMREYREVIRPYCRNCHMSQLPSAGGLDMLKAADLENIRALVVQDACSTHRMPHAQLPFKGLNDSGLQADLLGYFGRLDSLPAPTELCAP